MAEVDAADVVSNTCSRCAVPLLASMIYTPCRRYATQPELLRTTRAVRIVPTTSRVYAAFAASRCDGGKPCSGVTPNIKPQDAHPPCSRGRDSRAHIERAQRIRWGDHRRGHAGAGLGRRPQRGCRWRRRFLMLGCCSRLQCQRRRERARLHRANDELKVLAILRSDRSDRRWPQLSSRVHV